MRRHELGTRGWRRGRAGRAAGVLAVAAVAAVAVGACGGGPEPVDAMRPADSPGAGAEAPPGEVTIEDTDIGTAPGSVEYEGGSWTRCGGCDVATDDASYHYGYEAGQSYTVRFTGTRLTVLAPDDAHGGVADVTVDGAPAATPTVDFAAADPAARTSAVRWDSGPVPAGDHAVTFAIRPGDDEVVLFDRAVVDAAATPAPEPAPAPAPAPTEPPAPAPDPAPAPEPAPAPAPGDPAAAPGLLGAGVENPYAFADWLGRPVDVWETWQPQTTWADMEGLPTVHQYFTGEGGAPFDRRWEGAMSFSQPMWAVGENAATCAGGANDGHMATIGRGLVDAGYGDAWIRLGWEMDGYWFGATQGAWQDPEGWVACWRRWHDVLADVSPGFRMVWNPNFSSNTGAGPFDVRTVWPGDDYVDAAGPDYYDWDLDPDGTGAGGAPVGINEWVRFVVEEHGKLFVMPEWGLNTPNGGGDDAAFIHQVFDVLDDLRARGMLAYASYFNLQGCTFQIEVGGCNPASAAAYRERAGAF